MEQINNQQLKSIRGGGISLGFIFAIAGLITFVIGLFDGYVRPLKCNT